MSKQDIFQQLRDLKNEERFSEASDRLTSKWEADRLGVDVVEPILKFMEEHPSIDYGLPGALVHFVEQFHRHGYESLLIDSIRRKPTPHTVWMFNRLINGTKSEELRQKYIAELQNVGLNRDADKITWERAEFYINNL